MLVGMASTVPEAVVAQGRAQSGTPSDTAVIDLPDIIGQNASRKLPHWIAPRRGEGRVTSNEEGAVGPAPAALDGAPDAPPGDWRSGTEILVHGGPAAERLSEVVEALLRRLGAESVERRAVEISATTDQVRYFHVEDASGAAALAEALEPVFGDLRVRDLTTYRPTPPPGSLEIWLR